MKTQVLDANYLNRLEILIDQRNLSEFRGLLKKSWLSVKLERLPKGDVWVIKGFSLDYPVVEFLRGRVTVVGSHRLVFISDFWPMAAPELWEAGHFSRLEHRLSGALCLYHPKTYYIYGKLLKRNGHIIESGKYFMFSGLYSSDEASAVEIYKNKMKTMLPRQVMSEFPKACRSRVARSQFSKKVTEDLHDIPCPKWFLSPSSLLS